MAYASNRFETGADETSVTAGNSGTNLDRAFDQVTGTITYDSAHAAHGGLSARIDLVDDTSAQVRWNDAADTNSVCYTRMYVWADAIPSQKTRLIQYHDSTGALFCSLRWWPDNTTEVLGSGSTSIMTNVHPLPVGQWIRIEMKVTPGATTGSVEVRFYTDPDSVTPDHTSVSTAAWNTGTGYGSWRFGAAGSAQTWSVWIDDVAVGFDDWLGPAQYVRPSGRPSTAAVGSPALVKQVSPTFPTGIASTAALGVPALATRLALTGVASTAAAGAPVLGLQVDPVGIGTTAALGRVALGLDVAPDGVAGTAGVGTPQVSTPDPNMIFPVGIAPTSNVGYAVIHSPQDDWMYGSEFQYELNRIAHTTGLGEAEAANRIAGTTDLEVVAALNVAAGTEAEDYDLVGACNALAGTTGLGAPAALSKVVA